MDFVDFTNEETAAERQIRSMKLIHDVKWCHHKTTAKMLAAVLGQAQLARKREDRAWLKEVAYQAEKEGFATASWVDDNLWKQKRRKNKEVYSRACYKDVRVGSDPDVVVTRYSEGRAPSILEDLVNVEPRDTETNSNSEPISDILLDTCEDEELDYEDDMEVDLTVGYPAPLPPVIEDPPSATPGVHVEAVTTPLTFAHPEVVSPVLHVEALAITATPLTGTATPLSVTHPEVHHPSFQAAARFTASASFDCTDPKKPCGVPYWTATFRKSPVFALAGADYTVCRRHPPDSRWPQVQKRPRPGSDPPHPVQQGRS